MIMDSKLIIYSSFILLGTLISAIAQVMLKKAALKEYPSKIMEYLNPLVIIAYIIFFGSTFLSIYAYKVVPLSMGPILEATGYIYVTAFGVFIFNEKINLKKIVALIIILAGIVIYSLF
ncbi:MAG: multidrug ABC transporter [Lachnospiraceae bacterium]|nr:multidrug ABC transporter [Lachnospiraceae bacterium]